MLGKLNQLNSKKQGKVYIVLAVCLVSFFIIGIVAAIGGNLWANKNRVNDKLVVVSPHPVSFMEPLINEFEIETGIQVEVKSCGTTEAIQMIEEDENVDLMWGGSVLTVGPYKDDFLPSMNCRLRWLLIFSLSIAVVIPFWVMVSLISL